MPVKTAVRIEHDLLGRKEVPDAAYYGVQNDIKQIQKYFEEY